MPSSSPAASPLAPSLPLPLGPSSAVRPLLARLCLGAFALAAPPASTPFAQIPTWLAGSGLSSSVAILDSNSGSCPLTSHAVGPVWLPHSGSRPRTPRHRLCPHQPGVPRGREHPSGPCCSPGRRGPSLWISLLTPDCQLAPRHDVLGQESRAPESTASGKAEALSKAMWRRTRMAAGVQEGQHPRHPPAAPAFQTPFGPSSPRFAPPTRGPGALSCQADADGPHLFFGLPCGP